MECSPISNCTEWDCWKSCNICISVTVVEQILAYLQIIHPVFMTEMDCDPIFLYEHVLIGTLFTST